MNLPFAAHGAARGAPVSLPAPTALLTFRHDQVIYRQGEHRPGLYAVVAGHVRLAACNSGGDEFIKAILPRNEFFGPALDGGEVCEESAVARGVTRVACYAGAELDAALRPEALPAALLASVARQKRFQERRLQRLRLGDLECRVAGMIHELAHHYGASCPHGHAIDFRMTQDELASLVGASRPVVSAILKRFKRVGLISYTRAYICIDDLAALAARAGC